MELEKRKIRTRKDLIGGYVRSPHPMRNRYQSISSYTRMRIKDRQGGSGIELEADPCDKCGVGIYIKIPGPWKVAMRELEYLGHPVEDGQ